MEARSGLPPIGEIERFRHRSDEVGHAAREILAAHAATVADGATVADINVAADRTLADQLQAGAPAAAIAATAAAFAAALHRRAAAHPGEGGDLVRAIERGAGSTITRRRLLAGALATTGATVIGGPLMTRDQAAALVEPRRTMAVDGPHIVEIVIDDLGANVGHLGTGTYSSFVQTPNIDALAADPNSTTFMDHHVTVPLCPGSRATLWWGLDATAHGLTGRYRVSDDPPTWNHDAWFADNNVHFANILKLFDIDRYGGGKMFHNRIGNEDSWTEFFDTNYHRSGSQPWGPYGTFFDFGTLPAGATNPDQDLTDWAVAKLGSLGARQFYLGVGLRLPHLGWVVPQSYVDLYPLGDIVEPATPADDWDDLGPIAQSMLEQYQWWWDDGWYQIVQDSGAAKEHIQHYLAAVSHTDAMVGQILNEVAAQPYADDTVVVLVSDNGYHLGENFAMRKLTLRNTSTHTPFIINAPSGIGFTPGPVTQPVSSLNHAPTLLDVLGAYQPATMTGSSLRNGVPTGVITQHISNTDIDNPTLSTTSMSYYTGTNGWRWSFHHQNGALAEMELYNQATDPGEFVNLLDPNGPPT